MALHVAPRRDTPVGIVAFSGRLIRPERLQTDTKVKPPVMLIHGDADQMVSFDEMRIAGQALTAAGFNVRARHERNGARNCPRWFAICACFYGRQAWMSVFMPFACVQKLELGLYAPQRN